LLFTQVYAAAITWGSDWAPAGSPYLVAAALQLVAAVIALASTRPRQPSTPR
jgi:hypothetical protein